MDPVLRPKRLQSLFCNPYTSARIGKEGRQRLQLAKRIELFCLQLTSLTAFSEFAHFLISLSLKNHHSAESRVPRNKAFLQSSASSLFFTQAMMDFSRFSTELYQDFLSHPCLPALTRAAIPLGTFDSMPLSLVCGFTLFCPQASSLFSLISITLPIFT